MYPNIYGDKAYLRELRNFFFRVLGMMDVTFYGAIGDGRTDNYANLQVAIDDANRRKLEFIYVPFGTYGYRGELINRERITFVGNPNARIINLNTGEKIEVKQFGVCPWKLCPLRTVTLTFINTDTTHPVYLLVKPIGEDAFTILEDPDHKMKLVVPKDKPLSSEFEYIKIVYNSGEYEEEFGLGVTYEQDTEIEVDGDKIKTVTLSFSGYASAIPSHNATKMFVKFIFKDDTEEHTYWFTSIMPYYLACIKGEALSNMYSELKVGVCFGGAEEPDLYKDIDLTKVTAGDTLLEVVDSVTHAYNGTSSDYDFGVDPGFDFVSWLEAGQVAENNDDFTIGGDDNQGGTEPGGNFDIGGDDNEGGNDNPGGNFDIGGDDNSGDNGGESDFTIGGNDNNDNDDDDEHDNFGI